MMFGGALMMLFGLIALVLIVAFPAVLIAFLVRPASQRIDSPSNPAFQFYCSHCGQGLRAGWTHCPQCGTPTHQKE